MDGCHNTERTYTYVNCRCVTLLIDDYRLNFLFAKTQLALGKKHLNLVDSFLDIAKIIP